VFSNNSSDASTLRRRVTVAGIALIVLIVAADSYEAWQDYVRVITDNAHTQTALSRAVAEQTARMVQELDIALSSNPGWPVNAGDQTDKPRMQQLLGRIMRLPFVHSAAIAGKDGQVLAHTGSETAPASLQTADVFTVPQASRDKTLYIDRLRTSDGDRQKSFALSQRIELSSGAFAGVVIAEVSFDYLADLYSRIASTPDTSIVLMRSDGGVLSRNPQPARAAANSGKTPSGRVLTEQPVEGYPLKVVVSRWQSDVLKPWIQEERSSAARTLSLAALAAILLAVLRSALDRQEKADRERLRLEQELAAVQRVEALGLLAASVTHDFNNVLTAIIGYAELTRETLGGDSPSAPNLDRLLAAGERARLLVRRVLTFDPRRSLSYKATRLEPIVMEAAQQVQATLPQNIELRISGLEPTTSVLGDNMEIHQVLMNLLTNAMHAMPAGGVLQIRCESMDIHETRNMALGRVRPGHWLCLSVIDNGVGLADAQIMSIFEPFYTTRPPTLGTGIGLTVVRNIILRMNGALDVSSQLGAGTRMAVFWPSIEIPLPDSDPTRTADDGTGETIMVIDDEKELVGLTEELLASMSYEPVGFSDGRSALDAFRSDPQRFDVILTDERMLPMRGLEFAQQIRELDAGIPIILMTGHRNAELDARAAALGIAEIIDKPLRVQTLREALARRLGRAEQPAQGSGTMPL
jgi:signal transduction histidine kinase/ActR/RegA family two-component response regulator